MHLEKACRMTMLFDFYGNLLTQKQREVMHLYYEQDLSLAEIAENLGTSRQAVYDTLKRSEKALEKFEEKLGLLENYQKEKDSRSREEG